MLEKPIKLHTAVLSVVGVLVFADLFLHAVTHSKSPVLLLDPIKMPVQGSGSEKQRRVPTALASL